MLRYKDEVARGGYKMEQQGQRPEFIGKYGLIVGSEGVMIDSRGSAGKAAAEVSDGAMGLVGRPLNGRAEAAFANISSRFDAEFGANRSLPLQPPGQEPAVQVRSDFRSTVFWQPDVVTDKDGKAVVKVKFPDSLTRWRATARVATEGNQFGVASATARTKQPLIVRQIGRASCRERV